MDWFSGKNRRILVFTAPLASLIGFMAVFLLSFTSPGRRAWLIFEERCKINPIPEGIPLKC